MSKFKLLVNWNGHKAGETISVPNSIDKVITAKIGEKVEEVFRNKAIVPKYKKKK